MTKLLLRLLMKDSCDITDPAVRFKIGRMAGIVGILCNSLMFLCKLATGLLTGSVSMVGDAVNNLSDASSSVVTLLGFHMAQRPADKDHPFGHARYEYLSGLVVAGLILLIGAELVKSSIEKIIQPVFADFSIWTMIVLIISMGLKLWLSVFYAVVGKRIDAAPLRAAAVDSRNDVMVSAAVLCGSLVDHIANVNLDGYVGLAVAVFILYSGFGIARETISPLLGQQADNELIEHISRLVLSHKKILGIHDLLVHDYGPGQYFASVHVEINADEDPLVCHDLIDDIECAVLEELNVHLVIHYDPVLVNDTEWDRTRQTVESILRDICPHLSMHDFRMVRGAAQTKLVFDLAIPYGADELRPIFAQQIKDALRSCGIPYKTIIRFDRKS